MIWRALFCVTVLAIGISEQVPAQETKSKETVGISFPGKNWEVRIDSPGFLVESQGPKGDGREYLLANNSNTGIVLSVTLEESKDGADSGTCPDFLRKRVDGLSRLGVTDVKTSEVNSMAVVEYLLPKPEGIPLRQKNFVLCAAKEDVYIDVHLSKVQFQPSDESLLMDVLAHVRISDRGASAASKSRGRWEQKQARTILWKEADFTLRTISRMRLAHTKRR
jgi:hypothetical protein